MPTPLTSSQYVYVSLNVYMTHSNGRNSFMMIDNRHTYQGKKQKANKDWFNGSLLDLGQARSTKKMGIIKIIVLLPFVFVHSGPT